MLTFLSKRLVSKWRVFVLGASAEIRLGFIQTTLSPIKSFSSSTISVKDELKQSFTVSYLVNSCGLPLETSISASHMYKLNFETLERPDSVLTLLRDNGFTSTQITKLIRARPRYLLAHPEKTLLPKLEFFRSIGVSSTDLAKMLSSNTSILASSLENRLMSWYNFLKSLLLDDKNAVKVMKRSFWQFNYHVQKNFAPNISVLRELGRPEYLVLSMVTRYSAVLAQNRYKFDKIVEELIEMGYDPKKREFGDAMYVVNRMSKSTREHKIELYRRLGWSEDHIQLLLKKHPLSMNLSEKNIMNAMDFLVNKMGYKIAAIAKYPMALGYSLEKRVIPRCSVIKVLLFKGLIKEDFSLSYFLPKNEKLFLEKFVTRYKEDVPQLLNVYKGKTSLLELGFGSEEICGMKLL